MKAPFIWFGGKSAVGDLVWDRLGTDGLHYCEPFAGSLAVLLARPKPAGGIEVVSDTDGFIANFWRCVVHRSDEVASHCDYPVSHVDLFGRHQWLLAQRESLAERLMDPNWSGDPKIAGWWLWGINAWIGREWCSWHGRARKSENIGQIPHISDGGQGIHSIGKIPHISDGGSGIHGVGAPHETLTTSGANAHQRLRELARRLERVRVLHGDWSRCLNSHPARHEGYPGKYFLDPPYPGYQALYGTKPVDHAEIVRWCLENGSKERICLAGHIGDYDLPGWETVEWKRCSETFGSNKTRDRECLWFSPSCEKPQRSLFDAIER